MFLAYPLFFLFSRLILNLEVTNRPQGRVKPGFFDDAFRLGTEKSQRSSLRVVLLYSYGGSIPARATVFLSRRVVAANEPQRVANATPTSTLRFTLFTTTRPMARKQSVSQSRTSRPLSPGFTQLYFLLSQRPSFRLCSFSSFILTRGARNSSLTCPSRLAQRRAKTRPL